MGEHNLDSGPPPWMSITGQPLDLKFEDSGFKGKVRSCKCPDELV